MIQQNRKEILSQARQLRPHQRWELAERLLESVRPSGDVSTAEEWEETWAMECHRRHTELKTGTVTAIP